jgi:hypothetical protein
MDNFAVINIDPVLNITCLFICNLYKDILRDTQREEECVQCSGPKSEGGIV